MAYNKEQWSKAKGLYEAGLSLSKIKEKTSIARNTVSQRAKREQWEQGKNSDYIETKVSLSKQKGTILEHSGTVALDIADMVADEKIRKENLVYGLTEQALKAARELIEHGTVEEKINIGDGIQKFEERKLNTSDIKNIIEASDRAAITLKVADRHAPKQDINLQANQQNNTETKRVTIARRSNRDN